ncbi:type 4 prepilin peptidase 1 . Aspartic peptidase. MEROPS family A24A [Alteromonadaceae bacterium Bs31]|nr:type 4 prepilin peptidase 1 . Aspartic peptidase. MEROPS family A24A [Alteromonadaceae bacterium Bs31]
MESSYTDWAQLIGLFVACALVLGLLVGSFLNVVIYRLPLSMLAKWKTECEEFLREHQSDEPISDKDLNIVFPASHCPACKADIKPWQNIPIVSYLFLKGKCANCKAHISIRYPLVELCTGLLSAFCIYHFGFSYEGGLALVLTWALISLTMIDIDHQLLPDSITLPLMWMGLIANSFSVYTDLYSALFGAVFGYGILWAVYWLFKILTQKEGMGFGDFKLLAALGAWMGWQMLPLIIILSSLVGALIGIAGIIIQGRDKNIPIPFGPYLAIAGWIAFFWGEKITQIYLQFAKVA